MDKFKYQLHQLVNDRGYWQVISVVCDDVNLSFQIVQNGKGNLPSADKCFFGGATSILKGMTINYDDFCDTADEVANKKTRGGGYKYQPNFHYSDFMKLLTKIVDESTEFGHDVGFCEKLCEALEINLNSVPVNREALTQELSWLAVYWGAVA